MNFDERIKARLSKMNPLISAVGVNFKVMVVGGPAEKHIDQCLKSISRQTILIGLVKLFSIQWVIILILMLLNIKLIN